MLYSSVDDYLEKLEPPARKELQRIRQLVKSIIPEAKEVISYGMPGFKYKGRYMLGYAAFKDHLSLFPTAGPLESFQDKLKDFKLSKGTIQFTAEQPIPESLLRQIIEYKANEISNSN